MGRPWACSGTPFVRSIFLKGVGPSVLWPEYLALAAIGGTLIWFAARRFRAANG